MGVIANLGANQVAIDNGKDSIVIRHYVDGIKGGRTLDVTGFSSAVIRAGHVIIKESATDVYKPLPVSGSAYGTLPEGCEYVGVLKNSILTAEPFAAIMTSGEVNDVACPYSIKDIKAALKTAVPTLIFNHD